MTGIHLLIQYVNDRRPARQAEYDECVRRNLANPHIRSVHDLQEGPHVVVPDEFARHPKFQRFELNRWMTFDDAFRHANTVLPDKACCLVNLDIFLDPKVNWSRIAQTLQPPAVYCISRTEFDPNETTFRDPDLMKHAFAASQDAWLFRSPLTVENCDFELGTLGCDNAIAHRLKQSGYLPVNAPQRLRILHYDRVRGKTFQNHLDVYRSERTGQGEGTRPDREGSFVLPDIDMVPSVDELLRACNISELDRYALVCDLFNRYWRLP